MANSLPQKGKTFPPGEAGAQPVDRTSGFRVIYAAIFAFAVFYIFTVEITEFMLQRHFELAVAEAVQVEPAGGPVPARIRQRVGRALADSGWTGVAGVRVSVFVVGADGLLIYPYPGMPEPGGVDPGAVAREAARILPASFDVTVALPHNSLVAVSILVAYAAAMLWGLFLYTRSLARREEALIQATETARETAAARTVEIEDELEGVRRRLASVDPAETEHAEEIRRLRSERRLLQEKLGTLARREEDLSSKARGNVELEEERQTLEDLLDESLRDVEQKDDEIRSLRRDIKTAAKVAPSGGRARESEQIARRLRTLYKNLEVDDRAVSDMVGLRDQTMMLKAEEAVKRLSDEAENAAVRRKVGGLPPGLPVFELGFAGKGRVYYTHGRARRFRILSVGAKNTQKTDLEYLSKVVKE